jgi:hypothetical protein
MLNQLDTYKTQMLISQTCHNIHFRNLRKTFGNAEITQSIDPANSLLLRDIDSHLFSPLYPDNQLTTIKHAATIQSPLLTPINFYLPMSQLRNVLSDNNMQAIPRDTRLRVAISNRSVNPYNHPAYQQMADHVEDGVKDACLNIHA